MSSELPPLRIGLTLLSDVLSGVFGAVCLVALGAPFDTVKVRLQTRGREYAGIGALRCCARMVRSEGAHSLWKGSGAALSSAVLENAVIFAVSGVLRRTFAGSGGEASVSSTQQAALGAVSGVFSSVAICPAEVVKCRMQIQSGHGPRHGGGSGSGANGGALRRYDSSWHCAVATVRSEGVPALFSGLRPLLVRDVPFYFLFLGSYRAYCELLLRAIRAPPAAHHEVPAWVALAAGSLAGATAWAVVYPVDAIKSREQVRGMLQPQPLAAATAAAGAATATSAVGREPLPPPRGALAELIASARGGGLRQLYAGGSAAITRGAIANGALLLGQNVASKALRPLLIGSDAETSAEG